MSSTMSAEPSVEPSSTTMISPTHGDSSTSRIASAIVACSLKHGITTERH